MNVSVCFFPCVCVYVFVFTKAGVGAEKRLLLSMDSEC